MLLSIKSLISSITVGIIIATAVIFIIIKMISDKKKGKSTGCGCGSSCSGCSMSGTCGSQKNSHQTPE